MKVIRIKTEQKKKVDIRKIDDEEARIATKKKKKKQVQGSCSDWICMWAWAH